MKRYNQYSMKPTLRPLASILIAVVSSWILSFISVHAEITSAGETPIPKVSAEVRFIAAGVQNARQTLECAQAKLSRYQYTPKAFFDSLRSSPDLPADMVLPVADLETTTSASWYYKRPDLTLMVQPDERSGNGLSEQIMVVNGDHASVLDRYADSEARRGPINRKNSSYQFGAILSSGSVLKNGIPGAGLEYLDPRSYAFFRFPGGKPLDELFMKNDPPAMYKGEEVVEGSRCMKVEAWLTKALQGTFWIDIEHGFLLRRIEERLRRGNEMVLRTKVEVPRILEDNGVYFPGVVEERQFLTTTKKGANKVAESYVVLKRVSITDFKSNCKMPSGAFTIKWPVGTRIEDTINQRRLIVVATDKQSLSAYNALRKKQGKDDLTGSIIENQELMEINNELKAQGKPPLIDPMAVMVDLEDLSVLEKLQAKQGGKR